MITNNLAEKRPDIAANWDYEVNYPLRPEDVRCSSKNKMAWVCSHGHRWDSPVYAQVAGRNCPYCTGRVASIGETDLSTVNPELAQEWHPTLNGTLTPQQVTAGSKKAVYWVCEKGHVWKATITDRNRGFGCPYCDGKKVDGSNSLATLCPDIAAQWHPTKNGKLNPNDVTPHSHKLVWWQCEEGHEWQARIDSRHERGCPVCSNYVIVAGINDLATLTPRLAAEWHPSKNDSLTPEMVSCNTTKKAWWLCPVCGHAWEARISHRHNGSGCPVCSGRVVRPGENLAILYPSIAAEWHPSRNGNRTPETVCAGSGYNAWWLCLECGCEWQATVLHRTRRLQKCPQCRELKPRIERMI